MSTKGNDRGPFIAEQFLNNFNSQNKKNFSSLFKNKSSDLVVPQGCNWLRCAGEVARCLAECSGGVGSLSCISCLGSAYNRCKDCF